MGSKDLFLLSQSKISGDNFDKIARFMEKTGYLKFFRRYPEKDELFKNIKIHVQDCDNKDKPFAATNTCMKNETEKNLVLLKTRENFA